jgi:uncharacterized protein YndB with AHSA1/START domain
MPASNASTKAAASAKDRELIFTRVFDAPRELVFEAWTNPKHLVQWWGPHGFTTTIHQMDVRPGGVWRLTMHGPDGVDYKNRLVFLEVAKPERLVYKHEPEEGCEPVTFEVTVTFAWERGNTRVTMRMLFPSTEEREFVVKKHGAVEGAKQTFSRLADVLPKIAPAPDVVITRVFDAPRELVFKAWTEPGRLSRWWGSNGFTVLSCEADPRPGGIIRIRSRAPDGAVYHNLGAFEEIAPPELLVFAMDARDQDGNIFLAGVTTATFAEHAGKTTLTTTIRITGPTPDAAKHAAGMEMGWNQSLERLAVELKEHAS